MLGSLLQCLQCFGRARSEFAERLHDSTADPCIRLLRQAFHQGRQDFKVLVRSEGAEAEGSIFTAVSLRVLPQGGKQLMDSLCRVDRPRGASRRRRRRPRLSPGRLWTDRQPDYPHADAHQVPEHAIPQRSVGLPIQGQPSHSNHRIKSPVEIGPVTAAVAVSLAPLVIRSILWSSLFRPLGSSINRSDDAKRSDSAG